MEPDDGSWKRREQEISGVRRLVSWGQPDQFGAVALSDHAIANIAAKKVCQRPPISVFES